MTDLDTEKAIKRIGSLWRAAFKTRDVDKIMSFYSADIVTYDMVPPLKFEGFAANRHNWISFFEAFDEDIGIETSDVYIITYGEMVVVHEFMHVSGTQKGQPFSVWARGTNVLRKEGGQWLIVHAHTSLPVDLSTQRACLGPEPS